MGKFRACCRRTNTRTFPSPPTAKLPVCGQQLTQDGDIGQGSSTTASRGAGEFMLGRLEVASFVPLTRTGIPSGPPATRTRAARPGWPSLQLKYSRAEVTVPLRLSCFSSVATQSKHVLCARETTVDTVSKRWATVEQSPSF